MMDGDIADVYAYRTGKEKDELLAMMDKETWLSAEDAAEMGFVDEVVAVNSKEKPKAEAKPVVKAICPAVQIAASEAGRRLRVKYGI